MIKSRSLSKSLWRYLLISITGFKSTLVNIFKAVFSTSLFKLRQADKSSDTARRTTSNLSHQLISILLNFSATGENRLLHAETKKQIAPLQRYIQEWHQKYIFSEVFAYRFSGYSLTSSEPSIRFKKFPVKSSELAYLEIILGWVGWLPKSMRTAFLGSVSKFYVAINSVWNSIRVCPKKSTWLCLIVFTIRDGSQIWWFCLFLRRKKKLQRAGNLIKAGEAELRHYPCEFLL